MRPQPDAPSSHDQFSVRSRHITGWQTTGIPADCSNRPDRVSSHQIFVVMPDHVVQADCDAAIVWLMTL